MNGTKFRVNRNGNYVTMSNFHFRDKTISLKAKGLLSQMLSLSDDWDYSLSGLAMINKEGIDAIRTAINELEKEGYVEKTRERDKAGRLRGILYDIYELPKSKEAYFNCQKNDNENGDKDKLTDNVSFAETVKKLQEVMK